MNDNLVRYQKMITTLLFKFDKNLIIKLFAAGYKQDILSDIMLASYESHNESSQFSFEIAQKKRNEIQKKLRNEYMRFRGDKEKYLFAQRGQKIIDKLRLEAIETLYIVGGAKAVYKHFQPKNEPSKRYITKMLSKCFGMRTREGSNKNSNQFRYSQIRKRFLQIESQGYEIRVAKSGSIYAEKPGEKKIRFSNHNAEKRTENRYVDVAEHYVIYQDINFS